MKYREPFCIYEVFILITFGVCYGVPSLYPPLTYNLVFIFIETRHACN